MQGVQSSLPLRQGHPQPQPPSPGLPSKAPLDQQTGTGKSLPLDQELCAAAAAHEVAPEPRRSSGTSTLERGPGALWASRTLRSPRYPVGTPAA